VGTGTETTARGRGSAGKALKRGSAAFFAVGAKRGASSPMAAPARPGKARVTAHPSPCLGGWGSLTQTLAPAFPTWPFHQRVLFWSVGLY